MSRLVRYMAAVALAVTALGAALLPLQSPAFTHALNDRHSQAAEAGLGREESLAVAERVRAFVVAGRGTLPEVVAGRAGFDAAQVSHLEDVRRVLSAARTATLTFGLFAAALLAVAVRRGGRMEAGRALIAAAALTIGLPLVAATAAVIDFDSFFAAFHSLFFRSGTWTFPSESLLIRLFPEPFWIGAGVAWAAVLGLIAVVFGVVGSRLARRAKRS